MKKLLSIFGFISITSMTASNFVASKNLDNNINSIKNNKIQELNFNEKQDDKQSEIILKNSLYLSDGLINIDFEKLSLNDFKYFETIDKNDLLKTIDWMYKLGFISYENNEFSFNDKIYLNLSLIKNVSFPDNDIDFSKCEAWVESHWYWAGGWKLHFNNYLTNVISELVDNLSLLTSILSLIPSIGQVATVAGVFLAALGYAIKMANKNQYGVYIFFQIIVPLYIASN
ncbi:hypothetical protein SLITO_v1c01240 [Spiroplasma litorale]|uniref:Transmembrane protein n=1 Tax=Spiroplasma litorale TaxID=216942 RepID=A0A0K1W132_9MOLU|nr:hypothetical protein [Spiroplasma litorale]AKX33792.1 hypothetical protein SLITO_v1c01240 [Spiroplasma litorale]